MMKKFLLIGLIVGLALILVGGVGVVYARAQAGNSPVAVTVTTNQFGGQDIPFGALPRGNQIDRGIQVGPGGMMGEYGFRTGPNGDAQGNGYGYGPGGMMGGYGGMMGRRGGLRGEGLMHEYMISAFASAVGLSVDEVNTRLANGETPKEIALAQGKTEADLPALRQQVRQDALKAAVAAGAITQAQADLMQEHMNNNSGKGFGPGNGFGDCPMWDGDEAQP
jgi:hypothetical protein